MAVLPRLLPKSKVPAPNELVARRWAEGELNGFVKIRLSDRQFKSPDWKKVLGLAIWWQSRLNPPAATRNLRVG
jgi:hypothetical protein